MIPKTATTCFVAAARLAIFCAVACGFVRSQQPTLLEQARAAAAAGKVQVAIDAYEGWLRESPADRAALREAGTFAFRERRWYESARWLERYVALDPTDPAGWFDLGAVRHNQCRFDLAIPAFRQLEALESTDPSLAARAEHRFFHGESARRLERFGEAIPELEIAAARAPERRDYRTALAQALFDGGRFDAAAAEFGRLVAAEATADAYYGLGCALGDGGKTDEAMAALKEARRLRPRDPRILLRLGNLALRQKDLRRAESYLVEARAAAPRNADVLFALAQAQRLSGQVEDAEAVLREAVEAKKEVDAAMERARVFTRSLVSRPEDVGEHMRYALDLLGQGRFDDAQVVFHRVLSFDPKNELAIMNLSSLLARQGQPAAAMKEVQKLLDDDPLHELASAQAARVRLLANDPKGALAFAAPALEKHPRSVALHEILIAITRAHGDAAAAARYEAALNELSATSSRVAR
jgi:tetratricopeptide (TPR) repeat protein